MVERRAEERVRAAGTGARSVDVEIESFPLVTNVLFRGRIEHITLTLGNITRSGLRFRRLGFELEGIRLDRDELFAGRPRARSIQRGAITARLDLDDLLAAANAPPLPDPGRALEQITIANGSIVLGGGAVPTVSVPLPDDLFPCDPSASVRGRRITVRCTVDPVPDALLRTYGILDS